MGHRGQYRRRKGLSLDGSVPGVEFNRPRGDYAVPPGLERAVEHHRPHAEYDPINAQYATDPGYGTPDPWDAIELDPRTPLLRFEPLRPEFPPRETCGYHRCLMTPELSERIWADVLARRGDLDRPDPIPIDHDTRASLGPIGPNFDSVGPSPIEDPVPNTPNTPYMMEGGFPEPLGMFDSPAIREPMAPAPMDMLSEMPMPEMPVPEIVAPDPVDAMPEPIVPMDPSGPNLEQIIEQFEPMPPMAPPDPYALMNQQFNQQMQLLDPFNLPGPMG